MRNAIGQPLVGKLIPDTAALRSGRHQPALAQAGQVVGQVRPGGPELLSHLRRIPRAACELNQHPATGRVGQRHPDAG